MLCISSGPEVGHILSNLFPAGNQFAMLINSSALLFRFSIKATALYRIHSFKLGTVSRQNLNKDYHNCTPFMAGFLNLPNPTLDEIRVANSVRILLHPGRLLTGYHMIHHLLSYCLKWSPGCCPYEAMMTKQEKALRKSWHADGKLRSTPSGRSLSRGTVGIYSRFITSFVFLHSNEILFRHIQDKVIN